MAVEMQEIAEHSARNIEGPQLGSGAYRVIAVPPDWVDSDPMNPRKGTGFDEASLRELGESMAKDGQIEPAVVRPWVQQIDQEKVSRAGERVGLDEPYRKLIRDEITRALNAGSRGYAHASGSTAYWESMSEVYRDEGLRMGLVVEPEPRTREGGCPFAVRPQPQYRLIAGERRWRAAKLVGLPLLSVRVLTDVDDHQALRMMIAENDQRSDLDPIERAEGYKRLADLGTPVKEIAAAVKKSQPAVSNAMRLLELPADVQDRIRHDELKPAHGVAICAVKDLPGVPSRLAERAVAENWSAHQVEEYVHELAKIRKWPEVAAAVLEPDGVELKRLMDWHPNTYLKEYVPERVKTFLYHHALQEEKRQLEDKLRVAGKTVLAKAPSYQDKAYEELQSWGDGTKLHDDGTLTCEACYVEISGRVWTRRYCTDPHAMRVALAKARRERPPDEYELRQRERRAQNAARAKERDEAIGRWIADFQKPTLADLSLIARQRLSVNWYGVGPHPLSQVATWLGIPGKSADERVQATVAAIKDWQGSDLIKGWILSEISREVRSEDPVPDWLKPWLEAQGYVDPIAPAASAEEPAALAASAEIPIVRCNRPAVYRLEITHPDGSVTYRAVCDNEAHVNILDREEDEKAGEELDSELVDALPGEICEAAAPRMCRVCGCTDEYGCDEGCEWVEEDLCSACVDKEEASHEPK